MGNVNLELIEAGFIITDPRKKSAKKKAQPRDRHRHLVISFEAWVQLYLYPVVVICFPFCLIPILVWLLSLTTKRILSVAVKLLLVKCHLRDTLMQICQKNSDMFMLGEVLEFTKM